MCTIGSECHECAIKHFCREKGMPVMGQHQSVMGLSTYKTLLGAIVGKFCCSSAARLIRLEVGRGQNGVWGEEGGGEGNNLYCHIRFDFVPTQ